MTTKRAYLRRRLEENGCETCPVFPYYFLHELSTSFFCKVGHLLLQRQQNCLGETECLKPYCITCFSALFPFLHAVIYPDTLLWGGVKNWCHAKIEADVPPCLPVGYGCRSGVKKWCQRRICRGGKPVWRGYVLNWRYLRVSLSVDNQQDTGRTNLGN